MVNLSCVAMSGREEKPSQDPGQGGHPAGPAALDLRGQAARGRADLVGLQHPEGVNSALGAAPTGLDQ